ncbi:MAG TPA: hypothetical protein VGC52_05475 [Gemmatimonadaceae bacterium]
MTGRARFWRAAAVVFTLVNVGGGIYAAANGEVMHALVHAGLVAGTYVMWQSIRKRGESRAVTSQPPFDEELGRLQHSLDAIALEVERIGEGQRFINKLQQGALHDSEAQIGRVPAVLPEEESEDGQAQKPRDVQDSGSG